MIGKALYRKKVFRTNKFCAWSGSFAGKITTPGILSYFRRKQG
ncbi:MAG: hypothetical protein GQF41_2495 [Candidatus Rifleibacterium amylolyticum]|nr:MAG: hypothetical protein GQF41_2495 [Candidatus Rifleibacterium amylolyticum]